jgi:3-deoxy-D-manno-octulosonic-acid transferase
MFFLYRLIFILSIIFGAPFLLIKAMAGRHGIKERLGFVRARKSSGRLFWFHAASVGELKILSLVIPKIVQGHKGVEIAVSTTTITGRKMAEKLFGEFALVFIHPIELKSAVNRTLSRIKPERLIIAETELWPLCLSCALEKEIELYLINGRMSARSFRLYTIIRKIIRPLLSRFRNIMVQTADDADRFKKLGASVVSIVGNIKYDQVLDNKEINPPGIKFEPDDGLIFVAGSVRKGEDQILLDAIVASFAENLPYRFILVPRHMKDVGRLCAGLGSKSIKYALWSEYNREALSGRTVLVVNTMGDLPGV